MATRSKQRASRVKQIPIHVRSVDGALPEVDRDTVERKLARRFTKFARSVERVTARFEDVNGPRGGIDKLCRIKVVLAGLPSVLVEERHDAARPALDLALERAVRAVRRSIQRRRTTRVRAKRSPAVTA